MAQVIQIKRRIPGTGAPATLAAGEPATSISGAGVADLFIGDGGAVRTLVSAARQVELAGDQTITGKKTIDVDHLKLEGGDANDLLTTDGDGNLDWVARGDVGMQSVHVSAPLSGSGTSGSPITVTPATNPQIATGTDNVHPITPAGLRTQLGEDAADLDTTAKTVVPAINELNGDITTLGGQIQAISGALRFVGNFDADESEVTTAVAGTVVSGQNLPAPATANEGWYVIVVEAGTPSAPAPTVPMQAGDWIVSTGSQWVHIPLYHTATTAANVGITQIDAQSWTNVQQALEGLHGSLDDYLPLTGGTVTGGVSGPWFHADDFYVGDTNDPPPWTYISRGAINWFDIWQLRTSDPADAFGGAADHFALGTSGAIPAIRINPNNDLLLAHDPTLALGAATKQYVDNQVSGAMTSVNVDGVSIVGNGTSTALSVGTVDGGTF